MKKILVLLACLTGMYFFVFAANDDFECPEANGRFANLNDMDENGISNSYYDCMHWIAVLSYCPPGLGYDPLKFMCELLEKIQGDKTEPVQAYCRCKHDGCFAGNKYSVRALCGRGNCPDNKSWCY